MNIWKNIEKNKIKPEKFIACIEISKGSKMKYEYDIETGFLLLDRVLFTSTHYPANYGFIPRTIAGDGDPLDVLVLCSEKIDTLALVEVKPIGVIKLIDENLTDDKIIAIPTGDPTFNQYKDLNELPHHMLEEISHFFEVYKTLEGKVTSILDIHGIKEAKKIIKDSIKTFNKQNGDEK